MQSDHFRNLVGARGPFASVYFEDSHNTADAAAQLGVKWRDLRDQLEAQGADGILTGALQRAILTARPPVGRSGRAVIAGPGGVLVDEHLIRPPVSTVARVSELPYLIPLVEYGDERPAYLVVAVDHTGADLTVYDGQSVDATTVQGEGYPIHKAAGAEGPYYGDPQPKVEEQAKKNLRLVAHRVSEVVDGSAIDIVFVLGEIRSRADLLAELPQRVRGKVVELAVGARDSGIDVHDVQKAIDSEFERRRNAVLGEIASRFEEGRGREKKLAVEGLTDVCAALRDGSVETLIVGEMGDATLVADEHLDAVAPDADLLSELGAAPEKTIRADEALPMAAIAVGAAVMKADERINPASGVAALLRYASTSAR